MIIPRVRLVSFIAFAILTLTLISPLAAQTLDAEEAAFLTLINNYRAQNGLGPLRASIALTNSSKWMSADMAGKNYFSHTDSQGRDPFTRMANFGYSYNTYMAENIAAGYADAASTFNQWKNSPGHNTNMLGASYTVIGIGRAYSGSATYRWYWTTDFGGYTDATLNTGGGTTAGPLTTVNAANYTAALAANSIAAAFGSNLTTGTYTASVMPLPTSLGGTVVTVNNVPAQVFYVSPTQINYIIPAGVGAGSMTVNVTTNGTLTASGTINVTPVAPALFTATSDGKGAPAGFSTFDGINMQLLSNLDGTPRPVGAGSDSSPNYLILYGTGLRGRSNLNNVQVTVGGVAAQVQFAGAQPSYAGLDQLNLKLPTSLRGRGTVEVVLTIDGTVANKVVVSVM